MEWKASLKWRLFFMTCYHPITAYWSRILKTKLGTPAITFKYSDADPELGEFQIPCGQCIGCRLDRSLDSAVRAHHESLLYDQNYFLTLTYDNDHLPPFGSLIPRDLTLFWKRIRKRGINLRYMACGEYGSTYGRPHYHAIIFNLPPLELRQIGTTKTGFPTFVNDLFAECWPFGFHTLNFVSFESCAYVARYVTKKILGDGKEIYEKFDPETGEVDCRVKEFSRWSTKPGIGHDYFMKYWRDFYKIDCCLINNKKFKIPRYYDRLLLREHPDVFEIVKQKRILSAQSYRLTPDAQKDRLAVREEVKRLRAERLLRPYEAQITEYLENV